MSALGIWFFWNVFYVLDAETSNVAVHATQILFSCAHQTGMFDICSNFSLIHIDMAAIFCQHPNSCLNYLLFPPMFFFYSLEDVKASIHPNYKFISVTLNE
ncbi:hypothetical protein KFK09_014966 [Dendrobium nobile]|uniref:Secreted protein n=1 Tax=Dendrobium nobile TaxID=94219 RepID=A0A8T3B5D8_DENNO|nr:hypothetical protein KFK09_014966 [Dendrobium nobile]